MTETMMKLTFLGTGTSMGVPVIGCRCATCLSCDPRDKRLRTSALLETSGGTLLIDCGPDFRAQMLREGSPAVDAVVLTHSHYDHVGGLDDLRPYCLRSGSDIPVYCRADVARDLRERMPYCFGDHLYPGVPKFNLVEVSENRAFKAVGHEIMPLGVFHGRRPILGYRIGRLGYVTDCLVMPPVTRDLLRGVDTLVVNALRRAPHATHMNLAEALDVVRDIRPRKAYFIHLADSMGTHADASGLLPAGVEIAYDGLKIDIAD